MGEAAAIRTGRVSAEEMDSSVAQAMLDSSPECVKLLEPSGHLRFMSANGLELMQIPDFERVEGALWWELWPESSRAVLRDAVASANRGVTVSFEAACPTAGGVDKHWRVRVSRVTGGRLDGMILAASEDITAAIAERRLRERLDHENEGLRRFTHLVAHDLRSPIRHLKVLSDLVIEESGGADGGETDAVVARIGSTADALLDLLNGLEKLHTVSAGTVRVEPIDLRGVVERARSLVGAGEGELSLSIDGDARTLCDEGLMIVAFRNLLDNSLKYRVPGSPCRVEVAIRAVDSGSIEIVVRDDGIGFAADRLDEVFLPLVRQSNGLGLPGAGIGLALVRNVVDKHGGAVDVMDVPSGAAIRLVLPACQGGNSPAPDEEEP